MKARSKNHMGLKVLLVLMVALNMSWVQKVFDKNANTIEMASNSPPSDAADSFVANPATKSVTYNRQIRVRSGRTTEDQQWHVRITKAQITRTDPWNPSPGKDEAKEDVYQVSARAEGCYGINCQASATFRAAEIGGNTSDVAAVVAQIQQRFDPTLDRKASQKSKEAEEARIEEEKEKKEAKRLEKLERAIAECKADPDTEKPFRSEYARLSCRAEKLGSKDGAEAEGEFAEIREDLRALLTSGNPSEMARAKELLGNMNSDSSLPRSMRSQLSAMRAGSYYNEQYPQALQNYLTTRNPIQMQISLGKMKQLDQGFKADTARFGNSFYGSEEFTFWQNELQHNMDLVLKDPRTALIGNREYSNGSDFPSQSFNIEGRLARGGGQSASAGTGYLGASQGQFWRGGDANGSRTPLYDRNSSIGSRGSSATVGGIPQLGQSVSGH
jgi:hypothetical protein